YSATDWQNAWTVFYWGWWIAWSPFVGMFIARISLGRTLREFILGVLLAPTLVTFLWFTVFGDTALQIELFGVGGLVEAVQANVATSLFAFLEQFPLALVSSVVSLILVAVFFVTSSDSGSLVIDIITSGGQTEPPTAQRVFWAVTEGVVAIVLLLGGGLVALQTAAITAGLPLAILLLLAMVALVRGLRAYVAEEHLDLRPEDELDSH
ncbi:MAG: BCCT family transporter, partial [Thiohalorhabdaceae bacterium]